MQIWRLRPAAFVAAALLTCVAIRAAADPPARVLRIGFLSGSVLFRPAAADQWTTATLNYPITVSDRVWTDPNGRVELQLGSTALRLASNTSLGVLNLDDQLMQLRLTQGALSLSVREMETDEAIEVDTPNGAVSISTQGLYRIDVSQAGDRTLVTVRAGEMEVVTEAATLTLSAGQAAEIAGLNPPSFALRSAPPPDEWEDWCAWRERRATDLAAERYVSRRMVGYDDLDAFGSWQLDVTYGLVWVPDVRASWAPYRFGHWTWIAPWGWTWVDDAPWGFAPFHYGRWAYARSRWFWVPGARVPHPIYAPALVVFVGGPHWSLSLAMHEPVVWFPLGPREPFQPDYAVPREYLRAINRPHVDIDTFIDLGKVDWVNRLVPGAVTAVPGTVFVRGEVVGSRGGVRIGADVMRTAPIHGTSPPLAPEAISRSGQGQRRGPPPAAPVDRGVVVRRAPPTPDASTRTVGPPTPPPRDRGPAARPQERPSPAPVPPPPPKGPSPSPKRGDLAARQALEQSRLEAGHAADQARLRARQEEEQRRTKDAEGQQQVGSRQEARRREQEDQQKREHQRTETQQQKQRERIPPEKKR